MPKKENITYSIQCKECSRVGKSAIYWGESARTGFRRGEEHLTGLIKEYETAPLWRHTRVFHGGRKCPEWFRMKIQKTHRTPLGRQVAEGVEINRCEADIIMNSKGEWNGSRLPRMIIERGEKIELDENDINVRMMNWEKQNKDIDITVISDSVKRKDTENEEVGDIQQVQKKRRIDSGERVNKVRELVKITNFFSRQEEKVQVDIIEKPEEKKDSVTDNLKEEEEKTEL